MRRVHSYIEEIEFSRFQLVNQWLCLLLVIGLTLGAAVYAGRLVPKTEANADVSPRPFDTEKLPDFITTNQLEAVVKRLNKEGGEQLDAYDALMDFAKMYGFDGNFANALECLRLIPTSHPRVGAAARFRQGQTAFNLRRYAEAEEQFHLFLNTGQGSVGMATEMKLDAIDQLALLYYTENRFKDLADLLQPLVRNGASHFHHLLQHCFPNLLIWQTEENFRRCRSMQEQDPENPDLMIALAQHHLARGEPRAAEELTTQAMRTDPQNERFLATYIDVLVALGNREEADRRLRRLAVQSYRLPDEDALRLHLVGWFLRHDKTVEGKSLLDQVLEENPCHQDALRKFIDLHRDAHADELSPQVDERLKSVKHRLEHVRGIQELLIKYQESGLTNYEIYLIIQHCEAIDLHDQAYLLARFLKLNGGEDAEINRVIEQQRRHIDWNDSLLSGD